jgi:phage gp29-like protein
MPQDGLAAALTPAARKNTPTARPLPAVNGLVGPQGRGETVTLFSKVKAWLTASAVAAAPASGLRDQASGIGDQKSAPLDRYILSSARDRWMAPDLRCYTPERVISTLRGAFSGDLTAQWELFDLMEGTSPRIAKNLAELKQTLEDFDWPLEAWASDGAEPSAEAQRRKRVVEEILWHMEPDPTLDENDFSDLCRDLADAWGKAVSVQELDWTTRPFEGGSIVALKASRWVHPRNYGYAEDASGTDRLMLRTSELKSSGTKPDAGYRMPDARFTTAAQWLPFPADKFLVGVAKQKTGHPIGAALLRPLAWWWAVTNFTGEWLVNLAQIFGVPIRWANYAQGAAPAQIAQIEAMLENMGSAAWGAFPAGTTLELKEALKAGQDNPQIAILNIFDKICDLLILGQSVTGDAGQKGGGLGTENNLKAEILSGRKQALLKWAVKTLNQQLIPAICRLNFGDTAEMPYFVCGEEDGEDAKTVAETFEIALRSGIALKKDFAYAQLGFPQPAKGDEVIEGRSPMPDPGLQMTERGRVGADTQPAFGQARAGTIVRASSAQQQLAANIAEDITGISAEWLGGALPWFRALAQAAEDPKVTDSEFEALIVRARRALPTEVAPLLNSQSLAVALENSMGAAMVNGAVTGYLSRKSKIGNRKPEIAGGVA